MKRTKQQFAQVMWGMVVFAVAAGTLVWGQDIGWQFNDLSLYDLFPLFGLLAFGLMWSHYVVAAIRKMSGLDKRLVKSYFSSTSLVVLVLILLHPGLLIFQLWNDGFGWPPGSYLEHYVAPSLKWAALLGSISLLVFLLFELHRWFEERTRWRYVQYASDTAMIAILIHGFKLGSHLQSGWFQFVWLFYAVTLLASFVILYTGKDKGKGVL